jgi:hypothetical protein
LSAPSGHAFQLIVNVAAIDKHQIRSDPLERVLPFGISRRGGHDRAL